MSHAMHVINIEPGNEVACDLCGDDWTDRTESGGLFGLGSKAICPTCEPKVLADAKRFGETHMIKARCVPGMSFADWVRKVLRRVE